MKEHILYMLAHKLVHRISTAGEIFDVIVKSPIGNDNVCYSGPVGRAVDNAAFINIVSMIALGRLLWDQMDRRSVDWQRTVKHINQCLENNTCHTQEGVQHIVNVFCGYDPIPVDVVVEAEVFKVGYYNGYITSTVIPNELRNEMNKYPELKEWYKDGIPPRHNPSFISAIEAVYPKDAFMGENYQDWLVAAGKVDRYYINDAMLPEGKGEFVVWGDEFITIE